MDRRATFNSTWLAAALIAPQLFLVFIFFYWPAAQSLYWALTLEPPFGGGNQFVGWQNFQTVFSDNLTGIRSGLDPVRRLLDDADARHRAPARDLR